MIFQLESFLPSNRLTWFLSKWTDDWTLGLVLEIALPTYFLDLVLFIYCGLQIPDGMCIDVEGMLWVALFNGGKVRV